MEGGQSGVAPGRRPCGCVLVVGYGNPLRRDDGVGQEVAEALTGVLASSGATVLAAHQILPEMAEDVSRAETVVFVDADASRPAGSVTIENLGPAASGGSPHELGPSEVLALAGDLYGASPRALIVSVGVADLSYGVGLSEAVRVAVPTAVEAVRAAVEEATARKEQEVRRRDA